MMMMFLPVLCEMCTSQISVVTNHPLLSFVVLRLVSLLITTGCAPSGQSARHPAVPAELEEESEQGGALDESLGCPSKSTANLLPGCSRRFFGGAFVPQSQI